MGIFEFESSCLQLRAEFVSRKTWNDSTSSLSSTLSSSRIVQKPISSPTRERGVHFDLESNKVYHTSTQADVGSATDLWYSEQEFSRNRQGMIQDTRCLILSSGLCQRILGRVYSENCLATSENHLDSIPVLRTKLSQVYEQFGDRIVGLEKYVVGAVMFEDGEQRRKSVLQSLEEGAILPNATLPSSLFAMEIAAAHSRCLDEESEEDSDDEDFSDDESDSDSEVD